ncbi:MAG TPA: methyltransferase domain-containing protein [Methylomirabilota bacterium]|jgi:SAM-dependent methyltransferase|nr:methyltransferase domain-containing protein [Methylomirabilota bacterium]
MADHGAVIERIRASAEEVRRTVDAVAPGKHGVSPREGEWSVLETLVHLRNVVVMVYGLRIRRLWYETDPVFADYDESMHRQATMDRQPRADQLVAMIVTEHEQLAGLLRELPDDRWNRVGRHPELGEMSIEFLARRVAEHAEEHARQIRNTAVEVREQARRRARAVAEEFRSRGDATGWFERVYATAHGDAGAVPWAALRPDRNLLEWVSRERLIGTGQKALVVGCGAGDDAEELARLGFEVVAFDIAPTAIDWCRRRFPGSPVRYAVADVLAPPGTWPGAFDFVLEAFTIQVLTGELRGRAIQSIARFVRPGGMLLVLARGREPDEDPGSLPWPLTRDELSLFERAGLRAVRFEDYLDRSGDSPVRRFRVTYQRAIQGT